MFNKLGKVDGRLNSVGNTLDNNSVVFSLSVVEKVPGTLKVATNTDSSSDSDLVWGKHLLSAFDSSI